MTKFIYTFSALWWTFNYDEAGNYIGGYAKSGNDNLPVSVVASGFEEAEKLALTALPTAEDKRHGWTLEIKSIQPLIGLE